MEKEAKKVSPVEFVRRQHDRGISKAFYPRLWDKKLRRLEQALTKHDFPPNMSG